MGAWISTHECLSALVRAGHDVEVCSSLGKGPAYEWEGITVWQGREFVEAVCAEADVVVSHFGDNGVAQGIARREGIPSVQIFHAVMTPQRRKQLALVPPDLAVFVSDALAASAPNVCSSIVVPSVIWPEEHRTSTPGDMVTLVNLCEDKGGRVFSHVAKMCPDLKFLGVRGGYGRQIEPRLPNVEIVPTTRNMRDDVWARTRLLLMPSKYETSGRVGLEALCSGIPVVCHPTPGLVETQGDAGIFVDRKDLQGWVEVVRGLMDDRDAWGVASDRALCRSAEMDPQDGLDLFVASLEALA